MGVATFLIGLMPTYDVIGVWVPILLVALRFLQGLGLGGGWGGAVLMPLESGDTTKRGLNASWPQVGVPIGLLLANGVLSLMGASPRTPRSWPGDGACRSCSAACWCWWDCGSG